jgi:hypothetical protein
VTKQDPVAATEAMYGVRLPREYAEFLRKGLYRDKKLVLDGGGTVYFVVVDKVHGHSDAELNGHEEGGDGVRGEMFSSAQEVGTDLSTFVPFARLGDADGLGSGSLAIDVSRASKAGICPVLLYEHDDGSFDEVAGSIKEFLETCEEDEEDEEEEEEEEDEDDDD